jgi:CBS domain-containing protein
VSPRAASRLESLGFPRVYDYAAGKADWGSYGLPLEGEADSSTRVSSIATAEAPTCRLDESVAEVAARLPESWDICVVTNDRQVVLGLLGRSALRTASKTTVESAMTPGPSTIRPSARVEAIRERMRAQSLTQIIVTRPDGTLFGVVRREDIEAGATSGVTSR